MRTSNKTRDVFKPTQTTPLTWHCFELAVFLQQGQSKEVGDFIHKDDVSGVEEQVGQEVQPLACSSSLYNVVPGQSEADRSTDNDMSKEVEL